MNHPELALRREGAFRSLSEGEIARQQSVHSEAEMCTKDVSIPHLPRLHCLRPPVCMWQEGHRASWRAKCTHDGIKPTPIVWSETNTASETVRQRMSGPCVNSAKIGFGPLPVCGRLAAWVPPGPPATPSYALLRPSAPPSAFLPPHLGSWAHRGASGLTCSPQSSR